MNLQKARRNKNGNTGLGWTYTWRHWCYPVGGWQSVVCNSVVDSKWGSGRPRNHLGNGGCLNELLGFFLDISPRCRLHDINFCKQLGRKDRGNPAGLVEASP